MMKANSRKFQFKIYIYIYKYEIILQLENSKSDLENVVGLLVSMTKWLEGKQRVGVRMLSLSMDQVRFWAE